MREGGAVEVIGAAKLPGGNAVEVIGAAELPGGIDAAELLGGIDAAELLGASDAGADGAVLPKPVNSGLVGKVG